MLGVSAAQWTGSVPDERPAGHAGTGSSPTLCRMHGEIDRPAAGSAARYAEPWGMIRGAGGHAQATTTSRSHGHYFVAFASAVTRTVANSN